jgi:hypothetical protein
MTAKRRAKVALAGYLVTLTFGAVFIAARVVAPDQSQNVALAAAIALALPLAIAFVGDRIQSFRGFGFEIETKSAAASLTEIDVSGIDGFHDFTAIELSEVNESGVSDIPSGGLPAQVVRAIETPGSELVKLDLRDGTYWWPTRLYLLAALLTDYTNVKRLVFVQAVEGGSDCPAYAGMAKPSAIVRGIERALPGMNAAYDVARNRAMEAAVDATQRAEVDPARLVGTIAESWPLAIQSIGIAEGGVGRRVNRAWLERTLGDDWRWAAIDAEGNGDSPLLQHQIVTSPEEYTALLADERLVRVIGRQRLATSIATAYLRRRLES